MNASGSGFDGAALFSAGMLALAGALSIMLAAVALDYVRVQRRSTTRLARFGLLGASGTLPAAGRRAAPVAEMLHRLGASLVARTPGPRLQELRGALVRAGVADRLAVEEFLGLRVVALLLGLVVGGVLAVVADLALRGLPWALATPLIPLAGLVGYALPPLVVAQMARRRREAIEQALPDSLDILVVTLEAGIAFDSAITFLCEHADNVFVEELRRYLSDLALGRSRREALEAMIERTRSLGVRQFATAVIQADELGTGMARALRAHARGLRVMRRLRAETVARQAPIKLLFPLVLCIMPALFIVIIGPAVLQALAVVGGYAR
jgi:tight adherence protein C